MIINGLNAIFIIGDSVRYYVMKDIFTCKNHFIFS